MNIKEIHHDPDTGTVTIHIKNKQNPIVCQALEVVNGNDGNPIHLVLDRLIHDASAEENDLWKISGAFVTELARYDVKHLMSVNMGHSGLPYLHH